jgi:GxxExxY protein
MKQETPLVRKIVGFAMEVHRELRPEFSERVNRGALIVDCSREGLEAEAFQKIKVLCEGVTAGDFVPDMVVSDESTSELLMIEKKAVSTRTKTHSYQLVNYLSSTETDNGLLLNFGSDSLEFRAKTRRYQNPKIHVDLTA